MQRLFHYMVCVRTVFTDPQKPMKVEPGIYPLNGADENAVVVTVFRTGSPAKAILHAEGAGASLILVYGGCK